MKLTGCRGNGNLPRPRDIPTKDALVLSERRWDELHIDFGDEAPREIFQRLGRQLETAFGALRAASFTAESLAAGRSAIPVRETREAMSARLAADMAVLFLRWPATRSCFDDGKLLFGRAEPVLVSANGVVSVGPEKRRALARSGLDRAFDLCVAGAVLDQLDRAPSSELCLPLTQGSAQLDFLSELLLDRLARRLDCAERLTVEILLAGESPSRSGLSDFVTRLRNLGCRIAVSGPGVSAVSVSHVDTLEPDMVRLPSAILFRARSSSDGATVLKHLVSAAETLASRPKVIVDGVQDAEDVRLIRESGARWMTGCYCGCAVPGIHPVFTPRTGALAA